MKKSTARHILTIVLVALLATGCQSNPTRPESRAPTTGSDVNDADRTRAEGAVVGAVVGGLLGAAIGKDTKETLIGATVGAGAGYLVGNEIAKRKQQYAREEDFLDAEIASAREYNAATASYNEQLSNDINRLDKRISLFESRYKANLASRSELQQERSEVQREVASANKVYGNVKKEYDIKTAVLDEQRNKGGPDSRYVSQLDREIVELKVNMDRLETNSARLAQLDERLML